MDFWLKFNKEKSNWTLHREKNITKEDRFSIFNQKQSNIASLASPVPLIYMIDVDKTSFSAFFSHNMGERKSKKK